MGIPNLNKFLTKKCQKSITKHPLGDLKNKTLVIDASIYLYKFAGQNKLIENFYAMISLLLFYEIVPIFVFDGKPPKEKKELIKERRLNKFKAESKYNELQEMINDTELSKHEIVEINNEMEKLKTQFIRIKESDVNTVKHLLDLFGVNYYDAMGEADILCAQIVNNNQAWGCMSEDTDLFVYGCKNVIRYISITHHNVINYHLPSILEELDMSFDDFRKIMVISGTDYNMNQKTSLAQTLTYYEKYRENGESMDFYEWLNTNTSYIYDMNSLNNVMKMFEINGIMQYANQCKSEKNTDELKIFLNSHGFIFL